MDLLFGFWVSAKFLANPSGVCVDFIINDFWVYLSLHGVSHATISLPFVFVLHLETRVGAFMPGMTRQQCVTVEPPKALALVAGVDKDVVTSA